MKHNRTCVRGGTHSHYIWWLEDSTKGKKKTINKYPGRHDSVKTSLRLWRRI